MDQAPGPNSICGGMLRVSELDTTACQFDVALGDVPLSRELPLMCPRLKRTVVPTMPYIAVGDYGSFECAVQAAAPSIRMARRFATNAVPHCRSSVPPVAARIQAERNSAAIVAPI